MALVLHSHPLSSYCWKVFIALRENGVKYEARMLNLGDAEVRSDFQKLWPMAKIPLLEDGGRIIPETSIQIEYIDRQYPGAVRLLPADPDHQLEARLWDRLFDSYVNGSMQRTIDQLLRPEAERNMHEMERSRSGLEAAYQLLEDRMPGPWGAGAEFSMADCAAAPALFYARAVHPIPDSAPRVQDYFERLMARPSVAQTIADARDWFHLFPLVHMLEPRFLKA